MKQPICHHCEVGRRPCNGPGSPFVLHSSMSEAQAKITLYETLTPLFPEVNAGSAGASSSPESTKKVALCLRRSPDTSNTLRARLVQCLDFPEPGYRVQTFAPFFPLLPHRIGKNHALDAAVECILAAHESLVGNSDISDGSAEILGLFQKAITALLDEVASIQDKPPSADAIAAALMLATCEIYNRKHRGAVWTSHIVGISAMICEWDPDQLYSEFELALLTAYAPISIAQCLTTKRVCFLSSSDWSNALLRSSRDESTRLSIQVDCLLALVPELFEKMSQSTPGRITNHDPTGTVTSRAWEIWRSLQRLQPAVPETLASSLLIKSTSRPPINQISNASYSFPDPRTARGFSMYWATKLIVINLLRRLGQSSEELTHIANAAIQHTSKSVEYAHSVRPLGCIYMTWGLPIAYVSVQNDDQLREWLLNASNMLFGPLKLQYSSLHFRSVGGVLAGGLVSWCHRRSLPIH